LIPEFVLMVICDLELEAHQQAMDVRIRVSLAATNDPISSSTANLRIY